MYKKKKQESDDDSDFVKSASDEGSDQSEFDVDEEEQEIEEDEDLSLEAEELEELQEEIQSLDGNVDIAGWDGHEDQVWDDFESGLPPSWPVVEVVNLDRKMTSKQKRLEFEPIDNSVTLNISNCFNEGMEPSKLVSKTDDTWKALEKEQLLSYLLHYGYYSKDQYSNVIENLDKSVDSLAKLRAISPDTPLLFLTCLYRLLIFWGHIVPSPVESKKQPLIVVTNSNLMDFSCYLCSKDCSSYRYICKSMQLIVCPGCFQVGRYPYTLSSLDFEGQTNALAEHSTSEVDWDDDEKYLLLKLIAGGEEWESIANKLKRPAAECQFVFLTIGGIEDVNSPVDLVKKLIGKSPNPVLQLAVIVAKCVHPGLGSEIAKASLVQLISCHRPSYDVNFAAAVCGFEAAIAKAVKIASFEKESITNLISELIKLEVEVLNLKLKILSMIGKDVTIVPAK